jgi:SAM-dependent methyltransferase
MAGSGGPRWDQGYVTDVAYTSNVYREATPCWLALTALLLGQRPPDLARPFRYADLGCGNGMTAVFVAATCPQAEVWGFDFNPVHIEAARSWAAAAGLSNITFVETSFAELAALPANGLPEFDFIVAHGVLSWVSPENQRLLFEVIGQRLRAGGLAYVAYNVTSGWAAMLPVHTLMHLIAQARPERTDLAVPAIFDQLARLKDGGAKYFAANPSVEARLDALRKADGRYLAHELLNADWHPVMAASVIDAMAGAKCQFVGSATLTENVDAISQPPGMLPLIAEASDPRLRETLRDLGAAQAFRRDVYRRGMVPLPAAEHVALLDALRFVRTAALPVESVSLTTNVGTFTGRPEVYRPLLTLLASGPLTLAAARQIEAFATRPMGDVVQTFMLLVGSGFAHPMLPDPGAGQSATRALNRAIARANANGIDMPQLAAPAIGSVIPADALETLVVGQLVNGAAADEAALAGQVLDALRRGGRSLQRAGSVVADPDESARLVGELVRTTLGSRLDLLRLLGIVGNESARRSEN